MAREEKRGRLAGWMLGVWLVLHQFLIGDSGPAADVAVFVLVSGFVLRSVGFFPPVFAWRLLLAGAVIFSLFVLKPSAVAVGALGGLFGSVLLLRPLSPRIGLWILLCCISVLAAVTLEERETVSALFVIVDVAVLMFLAQQVHAPSDSGVSVLDSVLRSLRLILPVAAVVTVVFWIFPALSSRTNAAFARFSGGDIMSPGEASEILLTHRVAFVSEFTESSAVPPFGDLYWRGQVLEKNDGLRWSFDPARMTSRVREGFLRESADWRYFQRLELDHALAALDRPFSVQAANNGTTVLETAGSAFSVLGSGEVLLEINSSAIPAHDFPDPKVASGSLDVPAKIRSDPRLRELAAKVIPAGESLQKKLDSLGRYFEGTGFSYTLRPGKMNSDNVGGFLFEGRKGFCGHYAASAANLLRLGGVPARIITGYRGGTWNPWLRTLTVRDSDAHAWVEAWDDSASQWRRFDPTSFVAPGLSNDLAYERNPEQWSWFRLVSAWTDAVMARAGNGLKTAMASHASLRDSWKIAAAIVCLAFIWWRVASRKIPADPCARCLAKLEALAALKKFPRKPGESPLAWLARLQEHFAGSPEAAELGRFAASYECLVYARGAPRAEHLAALRSAGASLARRIPPVRF